MKHTLRSTSVDPLKVIDFDRPIKSMRGFLFCLVLAFLIPVMFSSLVFAIPDGISNLTALNTIADAGVPQGEVRLQWTTPDPKDSSGTVHGYLVKYATSPIHTSNFYEAWVSTYTQTWELFTSSGTAETRNLTGLTAGLTYYFALVAVDSNTAYGIWRSSVDAGAEINTLNHAYPYITVAAPAWRYNDMRIYTTSVTWTWNLANNAAGYRVFASSDASNLSGTLDASTTFWVQQGLAPNTTGSVYIQSFNGLFTRDSSVHISSFTLSRVPVNVTASSRTTASLGVSWQENGNAPATRYSVQYSSDAGYGWWVNAMTLADSTTHYDNGLREATTYYYRVWSTNNDGMPVIPLLGAHKVQYSTTTLSIAPSQPGFQTAETGSAGTNDGEVELRWLSSGDDNATGICTDYLVKWATYTITSGNFASVSSQTVISAQQTVSGQLEPLLKITGLYPGATYSFALKARDEVGNLSVLSVVKSTTTKDTRPNPPTSVSAVALSSHTVKVNWVAPAFTGTDDRDAYKIYRATFPFSQMKLNVSTITVAHPTTFYITTSLRAEVTYYFRVSCLDKGPDPSKGYFSSPVFESILSLSTGSVRTPDTTPPAAISVISASTGTLEGHIKVRWTSTGDDAGGGALNGKYRIYWSSNPAYSFNKDIYRVQIATSTTPGTQNVYTSTGLTGGVTYYFRVWTVDETGNWSSVSKGATMWAQVDVTAPSAVTIFNATAYWRQAALTWVSTGDDGNDNPIVGGQFNIIYSTYANMSAASSVPVISTSATPGSAHRYVKTGLTNELTYYFNIRVVDERGNISVVSVSSPSACPKNNAPGTFALISPNNNTITNGKPTFEWATSTDPDAPYGDFVTYDLYYSTQPGLTSAVTSVSKGTSLSHTPATSLIEDATYYWKVSATDQDNSVTWSGETRQVRINAFNLAPSTFSLASPANASIISVQAPQVIWQPSRDRDPGDVVRYWVEYSKFADFISVSSSTLITGSTAYTLPALDENATYYWRVWATDNSSTTLCNAPAYFRVNATAEKPATFNITSPANDTRFTSTALTFAWEKTTDPDPAVNEQVTYTLIYSYVSDFVSSTSISGLLQNTTALVMPFDNRIYYWRVEAVGPDGQKRASSQDLTFYIDIAKQIPASFALREPLYSIIISTTLRPWFLWNEAIDPDPADTVRYYIDISVNGDFTGSQAIPTGTDTFYQPLDDLLDQSTYYWKVRASGFQGSPPVQVDNGFMYSSTGTFIISMRNSAPLPFALSSPSSGGEVTTKTPTFLWAQAVDSDLNDVVTYTLVISSAADFSAVFYSTASLLNAQFTMPTRLLEDRAYFWKVVARDRKGLETLCVSTFTFIIPVLTTPLAPAGLSSVLSSNEQNFTIHWSTVIKNTDGTSIDDLHGYRVYRALSLTSFNYATYTAFVSTGANQWTDTSVQGGKYFYVLRAVDVSGVESANSLIQESLNPNTLNIISQDAEVLVVLPSEVSQKFLEDNNQWGKNLTLNLERATGREVDNVLRAYDIKIKDTELNEISNYEFTAPLTIEFNYGDIAYTLAKKAPSLSFNAQALAVYWHNGIEYLRIGGYMDTAKRRFVVRAAKSGSYQLRQTSKAIAFGLASVNPKKVFTPGVAPYEKMTFTVDNPTGDKVTGKIFDIRGEYVADMASVGDATDTTVILEWAGTGVRKGVYLYQIEGDGQVINGTVLVAR